MSKTHFNPLRAPFFICNYMFALLSRVSLPPHLQLLKGRELLSVLPIGSRQALHTGGGTAGPWDLFQTGDRLGQRGAGVPDGRRAWAERGRRSYLVTLLQTLVTQQIILVLLSNSG